MTQPATMTAPAAHHGLAVVLVLLWLVLSGLYKGLLLGLGAVSVALTLWLTRRMEMYIPDEPPVALRLLPCLRYVCWLLGQIIASNLDLARRLLLPSLPIRPRVMDVPSTQRSDLARAVFANSITLTPGTLAMNVSDGHIQVHSLVGRVPALESGGMDRRVGALTRALAPRG